MSAYVQFADTTKTAVTSVFGCPQDPTQWPNQATVADTDARLLAFLDPASTLPGAQAAQIGVLSAAYAAAIAAPVSYVNKGGVTKTYQADPGSISNLQSMLLAFQAPAAVPTGFYWVAADNTQVPFTYSDLQGLAQAMGEQGFSAFHQLQLLKTEVVAAATIAAVQAIVWP